MTKEFWQFISGLIVYIWVLRNYYDVIYTN